MTVLKKITNQFEGTDVTTIIYKGRPCWIAREIGNVLGYAGKGKRLVNNLTEKWSDEFIENHDYKILEGEELYLFREIAEVVTDPVPRGGEVNPDPVPSHSRHIFLLFEPGLHLCFAKTKKPIGKKLRRFLVDEVMPQLVRSGEYSPNREVVDDEVVEKEVMDRIRFKSHALIREERLQRQQKAKAYRDLAELVRKSQRVTPEVAECYEIEAFEVLCDKDFSDIKPTNGGFWKGVSEIAYDLQDTIWAVGKATLKLGIRGNIPGICREIKLSEIRDGKPVMAYLYSPKAVKMIEKMIGRTRHPSCMEADYDLP